MTRPLKLDPHRCLPAAGPARDAAIALYEQVKNLPIISPHELTDSGHTDPEWFANNRPFNNAAELLLTPDHYVLRMLYC